MTTIYLQRHTRPDIDLSICYGNSDVKVRPEYAQQDLPQVQQRIKDYTIEYIYSSPLLRCQRLAEDIKAFKGVGFVNCDNRLKEINFGAWEMTPWDDIYNSVEGKLWFEDHLFCRTPQGESFDDVVTRARSFIEFLRSEIESKGLNNIMLVTHNGFIKAFLVALGRIDVSEAFDMNIEYGDTFKIEI